MCLRDYITDQLDCEGLVRALPLGVAGRTDWTFKLFNHLAKIWFTGVTCKMVISLLPGDILYTFQTIKWSGVKTYYFLTERMGNVLNCTLGSLYYNKLSRHYFQTCPKEPSHVDYIYCYKCQRAFSNLIATFETFVWENRHL